MIFLRKLHHKPFVWVISNLLFGWYQTFSSPPGAVIQTVREGQTPGGPISGLANPNGRRSALIKIHTSPKRQRRSGRLGLSRTTPPRRGNRTADADFRSDQSSHRPWPIQNCANNSLLTPKLSPFEQKNSLFICSGNFTVAL